MDWSKVFSFLQKLATMSAVAVVAYLGENGQDGGFVKDVWAQAKLASPFAAMLALMFVVDQIKERRTAQKELNERTIDFIKSTNLQTSTASDVLNTVKEMTAAMREVSAYFKFSTPVKKRGKQR